MRIVFVTELFRPSIGGQEIRYLEIIPHLVGMGHEVELLCIDHVGDLAEMEEVGGARIHRLVRDGHYKRKGAKLSRNPRTILAFTAAARRWLKEAHPDVVIYNQWPILPAFTGRKDCKLSVLDICEFRSGAMWNWFETKMVKGCHKTITVSQSLADKTLSRFPGTKVRAIPSGINVSSYANAGRDHLLFMGRLEAHKNPDLAIRAALAYSERTGTPKRVVVIGGGDMKDDLFAEFGDNPQVRITGFISDEEKIDLINRAELHLLPSIREGFPRGIAECMAAGVPTVTTEAPDNGSKDVVRQFQVGVVTELSVDAFSTGIELALEQYDDLVSNCEAGKWSLDWARLADELVSFVRSEV